RRPLSAFSEPVCASVNWEGRTISAPWSGDGGTVEQAAGIEFLVVGGAFLQGHWRPAVRGGQRSAGGSRTDSPSRVDRMLGPRHRAVNSETSNLRARAVVAASYLVDDIGVATRGPATM